MSNEHHSLSGRWTAARGMSNSTAPDGRPSGGAVRGRMPLDVKTIFKLMVRRQPGSPLFPTRRASDLDDPLRERIAFCAYGRDRTHFVEPCREHPGPADSDTKVANVTTIKEN